MQSAVAYGLHSRVFLGGADGSVLAGQDLNLQPPDPKSGVLPVELPAIFIKSYPALLQA